MLEGIYFYWLSWVFWVIITFFMVNSKKRTSLSCWVLLSISTSNMYVSIYYYDISLTIIVLMIGSFLFFPHIKRSGYHIFGSFTVMIGYTSMLIWEAQAPVWIILPRILLIPLLCAVLICLLTKHFFPRLIIGLIGICSGEFLYSYMLANYSITKTVGEMMFFDSLVIMILLIICLELLRKANDKLHTVMQNYKLPMRWQNE